MRDIDEDFPAAVNVWPMSHEKLTEWEAWLTAEIVDDWTYSFGQMRFTNEGDAIIFKLRFGL